MKLIESYYVSTRPYDDLQVGKIVELDIQQGKMADDTPRIVAIVGKEAKPDTGSSAKPSSEQDRRSQEISEHVWWKELGLCLRAGDIDKTKPAGKALRKAYYAKMFSVLDIKIEDTLTTE